MIKKITITAVAIRKAKKDGTPYMWNDKKTNTQKPRTLVSIKDDQETWYMGWSYKDGSAAETVQKGQTLELFITEDGTFKNWRFVKEEDKKDAELVELRARLAAAEGNTAQTTTADPTEAVPPKKAAKKTKPEEGEVNVDDIPF